MGLQSHGHGGKKEYHPGHLFVAVILHLIVFTHWGKRVCYGVRTRHVGRWQGFAYFTREGSTYCGSFWFSDKVDKEVTLLVGHTGEI